MKATHFLTPNGPVKILVWIQLTNELHTLYNNMTCLMLKTYYIYIHVFLDTPRKHDMRV